MYNYGIEDAGKTMKTNKAISGISLYGFSTSPIYYFGANEDRGKGKQRK